MFSTFLFFFLVASIICVPVPEQADIGLCLRQVESHGAEGPKPTEGVRVVSHEEAVQMDPSMSLIQCQFSVCCDFDGKCNCC